MEDQSAEIESLKEELRWAKSKIAAMQLDLDRWAEKNRIWAGEVVNRVMKKDQGQQEYPRAKTWALYQKSLEQREQEAELNRESDRQQAEKVRWQD